MPAVNGTQSKHICFLLFIRVCCTCVSFSHFDLETVEFWYYSENFEKQKTKSKTYQQEYIKQIFNFRKQETIKENVNNFKM